MESGVCGNKSFFIGQVNCVDDFVYITYELHKGIVIVHRGEVYEACYETDGKSEVFIRNKIDILIEENLRYFDCPIATLFEVLNHRTSSRFT